LATLKYGQLEDVANPVRFANSKSYLIGAIPLCYINIEVFIPSKTQTI